MDHSTRQDYFVRPATCGVIAAGFSMTTLGQAAIPMFGVNVPAPLLAFGAVYLGTCLSEVVHDELMPHIPKVGALLDAPLTEALAVANIAGTEMLLLQLTNAQAISDIGVLSIIAQAAGARIAGTYIADRWVGPLLASFTGDQ